MAALACFSGNFLQHDFMIGAAVLIMAMIVSLAYMFSKFLHKPEMEAWARAESYQAFISCVLAVSMVFFASIACEASNELTQQGGVPGASAFDIADKFLASNYEETIHTIYVLHGLKIVIDYLADYQVMYATNPLFIAPGFPGLSAVSQNINTILMIISVLSANLMVQRIGLQLIYQLAFSVFLPLGLVLRIFPFSRDAGAFLIAVSFGLYIVLPLTYVMAYEVMNNMPPEQAPGMLTFAAPLPIFPVLGPNLFFVSNAFSGPVERMFVTLKDLNFVLAATFFPALGMVITITFIRSLSKSIIHNT